MLFPSNLYDNSKSEEAIWWAMLLDIGGGSRMVEVMHQVLDPMEIKQSNIGEILDTEREMVLRGAERYGAYYVNAIEFSQFLGTEMLKSIKGDRFLFAMFLSQVKKHYLLALFSAVRLHHTQSMMNLRQVLEAGACAAYAIANIDPADFADVDKDGLLNPSQELTKKRYTWIDKHFPDGAKGIARMKKTINESAAHANILGAHYNFQADFEAGGFKTPFFDFEDDYFVKTDLWQISNVALGLVDLFYGINATVKALVLKDEFGPRFQALVEENNRLKAEMMSTERYQKVQKKQGG